MYELVKNECVFQSTYHINIDHTHKSMQRPETYHWLSEEYFFGQRKTGSFPEQETLNAKLIHLMKAGAI